MNRRSFLRSTAALIAVSGASSCKRPDGSGKESAPSGAAARVKLALNWVPEPEFGGFYAGREAGFYRDEGIDIEILGGGAGAPVLQMLAGGQVDFAIAGADGVLTAKARGVDLCPLFAAYQTSPAGIMAHASRATLADVFTGGTLAIEPGTAGGLFLKKKYGFDKVKIVPYDGGVARFLTDQDFSQQCFVTSEPLVAKKKGQTPKVFLVADEGFNPYETVVVTRRDFATKNGDLAARFVRATRRGWQRYLDDPSQANQVMARLNTSMDLDTFAEVAAAQRPLIETAETKARGLGTMSRERWETLSKQLVELGLIDAPPNLDELLVSLPPPKTEPSKK